MLERLFDRLANAAPLNADERNEMTTAVGPSQDCAIHETIQLEGMPLREIGIVLSGFLCAYKTLADGRRQILSCLLPGDMFHLQGLFIERGDYGIIALAPSKLAYLTQGALRKMICQAGNVMSGLWWTMLVEQSISREWLLNVGKRSGLERMAHFLCEIAARGQASGLSRADVSFLPTTQDDLADILGLSPVHVNRMLQNLRRDKLIRLKRRRLEILDLSRLQDLGMFDPQYLHLAEESETCAEHKTRGAAILH
ncbi:MAG: Crp/Fnr family transcriptional regulator [Alphaproteobacteria bacterium]